MRKLFRGSPVRPGDGLFLLFAGAAIPMGAYDIAPGWWMLLIGLGLGWVINLLARNE